MILKLIDAMTTHTKPKNICLEHLRKNYKLNVTEAYKIYDRLLNNEWEFVHGL